MYNKFLKEVLIIVVGKQAEGLADLLDGKKYVNEFIIAKKLGITINQTRNILYKISDHGLVSSIRKKDSKKGWYTYFWKFEEVRCLEFLKEVLSKRIEQVSNQIKSRETKDFYVCERCEREFNEETALAYDFTCNECGEVFTRKDNTKVIKEFKKELNKLKREFEQVEQELKKEKAKLESEKIKKRKKIEKLKKAKPSVSKKRRAKKKKFLAKKFKKSKIQKKKIKKKALKKRKPVRKKRRR